MHYANAVLEDLSVVIKRSIDKKYTAFVFGLMSSIMEAQHFFVSDVSAGVDWVKKLSGKQIYENGVIDIPPPYQLMTFSFEYPKDFAVRKRFILVDNRDDDELLVVGVHPIHGVFSEGKYGWMPALVSGTVEKRGPNVQFYPNCHRSPNNEKDIIAYRDRAHSDITLVMYYLELLSCNNIETKLNTIPSKMQKARKKRMKLPFFSYHTLVLKPTTRRDKEDEASGMWDNRVHLCRGHFKTFTPQRPLFGKITGRFWWQPAVRGNKNAGIVMKDYVI